MRVYVEADLPEHCYLVEAIWWLAFGVPPRLDFVAEEDPLNPWGYMNVEARRSERAAQSGDWSLGPSPIPRACFEARGIEIDYTRYANAFGLVDELPTPDEIQERVAHYREIIEGWSEDDDRKAEQDLAEAESRANEDRWAREVMSWAAGPIDQACARIFDSLRDGRLVAEGVVIPLHSDRPDTWQFRRIGCEEWTLRNCDWISSVLETSRESYLRVQVQVTDLLKVFPRPLEGGAAAPGSLHGGCLIVGTGPAVAAVLSRSRGRPPLADGMARTAICNEFMRRLRAGNLTDKIDAILQEAVEWAKEILGIDVGQTTARNYLAPVLEEVKLRKEIQKPVPK